MDAGLRVFFRIFVCAAFCALVPMGAKAQGDRGAMPGDFDYYILALSWSPAYCDGRGEAQERDRGGYDRRDSDRGGSYDRPDDRGYDRRRGGDGEEQCSGVRPYAFVLHGLWPQYERKGWPEMCETKERAWVPEELIDRMMDIMPSRRLVIQEYKKHGVCSGLEPRRYFEAARQAYGSIRIPEEYQDLSKSLAVSPEQIRRAFLDANPQLSADMIAVVCSRNLLRELRVCFTKDLSPRSCSRGEQNRQCSSGSVIMPPVRGGGVGPHGGPTERSDRL